MHVGQQCECSEEQYWGSNPQGVTYRLWLRAYFCDCWRIKTRRADPRHGRLQRSPGLVIDLILKLCLYWPLGTLGCCLAQPPHHSSSRLPRVSRTGSDSCSQECLAIISRPLRVGFGDPGGAAPLWLSFPENPLPRVLPKPAAGFWYGARLLLQRPRLC